MSKHTGQQAPHEIETKKSIYRVFDREKSDAAHETNTEQQQIADVIMEPPLVASSLRLVVAQEMVPNDAFFINVFYGFGKTKGVLTWQIIL